MCSATGCATRSIRALRSASDGGRPMRPTASTHRQRESETAPTAPGPTSAPAAASAPVEPVLRIVGLTWRLPTGADRENAVQDVSLEVRPQEILCVVGESGSGKSVTAFTVMGLLPKRQLTPTAGRLLLQGEDLLQATPARL